MSQATFSVRMDDSLKNEFELLCNDFGMNMTTAINIFAKTVVRERRIPFEIVSTRPVITREKAMQAFMELRAQAASKFPNGLSLEEINEEIEKARSGKADD